MKYSQNRQIELGDFLKTRRNKTKPEHLGIPAGSRRRTPGLRREEVAQLAGIGLTWYTWLEQGRDINVSEDVLNSLSRVFALNEEERSYLYTLANRPLTNKISGDQPVHDTLIRILQKFDLSYCPAYIMDSHWNIAAWNKNAAAVFGDFGQLPENERNVVELMFCNQDYMALFNNWEFHAKGIIARFHATMAKHMDDDWFVDFIQKLKHKSVRFSMWWSYYDIKSMTDVVKELTHPELGNLLFDFVSLDVSDNQNLKILVHNPDDQTAIQLKNFFA